jgi:hypothetical protein
VPEPGCASQNNRRQRWGSGQRLVQQAPLT